MNYRYDFVRLFYNRLRDPLDLVIRLNQLAQQDWELITIIDYGPVRRTWREWWADEEPARLLQIVCRQEIPPNERPIK